MRKISLLTLFAMLFCCMTMVAQGKYNLKGVIVDHETGDPVVGATVQLLLEASNKFVAGAAANEDGSFSFSGVEKKKYSLKITSVGYVEKMISLNMSEKKGHEINLGYMTLTSDERMLSEVTVTANAAKVQASGDSLIFNASAYRTPEGSTLEALVKLLPGAEVDDEGNITINGKTVSKILVDGKEFFLNDKEVAMKNIPVDMIEKLKTYEMKSDQARITGIDDGEEETVLDLSVKKGMKNGWFGNVNGVAGTEHRYDSRAMVNRFNDNMQVSALASAKNTPDRWGWNRATGLNSRKEIGGNFATTSDKLETGGSVKYNYTGTDRFTESSSETFAAETGRFSMSRGQNYSNENRIEANAKMEWKPDTMTNILFRPNFTYSREHGMKHSQSGSYNEDPNEVADNALSYNEKISLVSEGMSDVSSDAILKNLMDIVVNTNTSAQQTYSNKLEFNANMQINRKLNSRGRSITLRANGSVKDGESKQLSASDLFFNPSIVKDKDPEKNNRYYNTPSNSYSIMGMAMYSEPIFDRTYLQFSYRFSYSYSKNDRQAMIYESDAYSDLSRSLWANRYDIDAVLRFMNEIYQLQQDEKLSQFSEYRNYNQNISLQFRRVRKEYNLNIGVDFMPQRSVLNYRYMKMDYPEVTRSVFNVAPRVNLKYNFDKNTNLEFRYRGRSSQPSMTNLLDITDDSDPLHISKGNPGLKPSFNHSFDGGYHGYNPELQRGVWSWLHGEIQNNGIANKTTYDRTTGVRTTMPMNVNGNWNVSGGVGMNTGLGEKKYFSVGGNIGGRFANNVGFYNNVKAASDDNIDIKSITRNTGLNIGLNGNYRRDMINIELRSRMDYSHINNNVNVSANQNTYNYSYGTNIQLNMPWGMEIATDCNMSSRRGYSAKEMNTDELLWNASLSQSFLKGKALTLKAEIFDILGQQTNITRTVNAFTRTDSRNNAVYQYAMFSAIFRFSVFAGKNTMGTDQEKGQERRWRR